MASHTVPAAVPGPDEQPAAGAANTPRLGLLSSALSAVEPARGGFDLSPHAPASDQADGGQDGGEQPIAGATSAAYHSDGISNDASPSKSGNGGGKSPQESVWKAWLRAGAERWRKGKDVHLKRMDAEKAKHQANQVKVTRTETVNTAGGTLGKSTTTTTNKNDSGKLANGSGAGSNKPQNKSNTDTSKARSNGTDSASPKGSGSRAAASGGGTGSGGRGGRHEHGGGHSPTRQDSGAKGGKGTGSGKPGGGNAPSKGSGAPGDGPGRSGASAGGAGKAGAQGKDGKPGKDAPTKNPKPDANTSPQKQNKDGDRTPRKERLPDPKNSTGPNTAKDQPVKPDLKKPTKEHHKPDTNTAPGDTKPGDTKKDTPARQVKDQPQRQEHTKDGKPFNVRPSRETGYRDGTRAAKAHAHIEAWRDGARDGWTDLKEAAGRQKADLDKAHADRKKQQGDKPVNGTKTSADYHRPATPIPVAGIDAKNLTLGAGASRTTISRREVRSLKSFERRLNERKTALEKRAERAKQMKAHADAQVKKAHDLLEQVRGVKGGEKLTRGLARVEENAKAQAAKADELHKRAVRGADFCAAFLANLRARYGAMYQAVVDSPETVPAELAYYQES